MKNKRLFGLALIGIGIALLILSLFADLISLGSSSGFGWKQILGAVAGVAAAGVGWVLISRK